MLEEFRVKLDSISDTEMLGNAIGKIADPGDVICLNGNLGAGKTTLTQAIARGLNVPDECYVTSPSFAIMHEYQGDIPLYHMDFYRLSGSTDVVDLGFEELFYQDGLTIIEWSERAEEILPDNRVAIEIIMNEDQTRNVSFFTTDISLSNRFMQMLQKFIVAPL